MLHVILYTPLFSYSDIPVWVVGLISCCNVVVALNAIPLLVFLNKFVILLILGLWYVNVVLFFLCVCLLVVWEITLVLYLLAKFSE